MLIFGILFSGGRVVVDRRIVLITNFGGIMGEVDELGSLFVTFFVYFSLKLISSADNKAEIPFWMTDASFYKCVCTNSDC